MCQQNNDRMEYQTSINARLSSTPVAAVIPGNSAAEYVLTSGIYNFLSIYNALLVGRILLTWFPSAPPSIVGPLSSICDPYLNLFRGIIPPLGQIDISPILAFTGTENGGGGGEGEKKSPSCTLVLSVHACNRFAFFCTCEYLHLQP